MLFDNFIGNVEKFDYFRYYSVSNSISYSVYFIVSYSVSYSLCYSVVLV